MMGTVLLRSHTRWLGVLFVVAGLARDVRADQADVTHAVAATLWWCAGVGTTDGGSFESQCFTAYGDCLAYRDQVTPHERLEIAACASQPRAWVVAMPPARGVGTAAAVYEARQTRQECRAYRRALLASVGAKHLRVSPCRAQRPRQARGRNAATLRMQRAAASHAGAASAP
ncbi:MAG: hypothetical protein IPL79_08290 [Myxococcales bacterium]|nr:hypothetical protein [Myxococcales bacterium]